MATLPAKLIAKKAKAVAHPSGARWALRDLKGSLDGVRKAVDESCIPYHWKAAIKAELAERCVGFNFAWIDAHCFIERGNVTLHITITPDSVL